MTQTKPRSSNATAFILPMFAYLTIAMVYTYFADLVHVDDREPGDAISASVATWRYLVMFGIQIVVATGLIVFFQKTYLEHFPIRISPWSVPVGVVGVVLWIGICNLNLEPRLFAALGFDFSRPSFNPFSIEDNRVRAVFLALRFTALALIVPIVEELFVRGWLVRWVQDPNFETVSLKGLSLGALLTASGYGVMAHPNEAIAAFVWFGLVTWLMNRTGNLWDCVVAHAVTNLLLGIYIMKTGAWNLW